MNNLCFVNSKLDRVSVRPPLVAPMRLLLLLLDTPATRRERKREITELEVRLKVWLAFRKAGEKRERERQGNEIMMAAGGGGGGVCVWGEGGNRKAIEKEDPPQAAQPTRRALLSLLFTFKTWFSTVLLKTRLSSSFKSSLLLLITLLSK